MNFGDRPSGVSKWFYSGNPIRRLKTLLSLLHFSPRRWKKIPGRFFQRLKFTWVIFSIYVTCPSPSAPSSDVSHYIKVDAVFKQTFRYQRCMSFGRDCGWERERGWEWSRVSRRVVVFSEVESIQPYPCGQIIIVHGVFT